MRYAPRLMLLLLFVWACDDEAEEDTPPAEDAAIAADLPIETDGPAPDAEVPDAAMPDAAPVPAERVEADLAEVTEIPDGVDGTARVFVSASEDDLVGGPGATARVGDYVIENGRVRFVVGADERVLGPCPFGGNIIDADVRRPDGEAGQDVVGELCPFVNFGQTIEPETFEILEDGSDGGAAVLAVTGPVVLLDFIHLEGLVQGFIPNVSIGYDIDAELHSTMTVYYVLRPGDAGVRVVTALRNDGDAAIHVPLGHLQLSGGVTQLFNPLSPGGGFGSEGRGPSALQGTPLYVIASIGRHASSAYVPVPSIDERDGLPVSGAYVTISGVSVSLLGTLQVLPVLLANVAQIPTLPGLAHLEPGETSRFDHWHLVGDGNPATVLDQVARVLGVETVTLDGLVRRGDDPAAGVPVSAVGADGQAVNQARTDAEGRFAMQVPRGTWSLQPWVPGALLEAPVEVEVDDSTTAPDLVLTAAGQLNVRALRPDGAPTAARVTVLCIDVCPQRPTGAQRDVTKDGPLEGITAVVFTGVDGVADIPLAAGDYRVVVSRGPAWSVWPADTMETGGAEVTVVAGETLEVEAEIAEVVDTSGVVTADFHVHGIASPDAVVTHELRIRTLLAEGVDLAVSTDHDVVADFAPAIEALGAQDEIASIAGIEVTTFSYGHFNAFPLDRDPDSRNGGAVDWAGAEGHGMTPGEIFAALEARPGTQVVQMNHPEWGYVRAVGADLLRSTSSRDPAALRLPPVEPDPETGDTGLWSERFTAMEILSGHNEDSFWTRMRWWLLFLGRGFTPAGTAVTDTHGVLASQVAGARSWVTVGADHDSAADFDREVLAEAVNAGRLIGSNGPFFTVTARAGDASASVGETLEVEPGTTVAIEVDVQTPVWMQVEQAKLYTNVGGRLLENPSAVIDTPLPPTQESALEPAGEPEVVAEGHARQRWTARFEIEPDADAYVVVVLQGGSDLYPVALRSEVTPLGFSNPLYIDVDGGGFDHPPIDVGAQKRARPRQAPARRHIHRSDLEKLPWHRH